ncbi:GTPase-activating protein [Lithospermum erythrorhizon]|uniref:GTPase-activating protein n=1 Tax=Lithospermum erythrorhizon TaxID=34254 RepID=A0AAV3S243_LITER
MENACLFFALGCCIYDILQMENSSCDGPQPTKEPADTSHCPKVRLVKLLSEGGNDICADCGSPDPKWVSFNLGVFICIKCSGVHRSLGVHISKVLSVNLDDWTSEQVDILMELGGNRVVNMKFEACLPENFDKPKLDASIEERTDFIRKKYEQQQFVHSDSSPACPLPTSRSGSENTYNSMDMRHKKHTVQRIHDKVHSLRHSWKRSGNKGPKKSHSMAGMVEFLGLIKVNVVRGTNLVVRDMTSSDPYVVLSLGNQTLKTRVIKKNLNPVWNEQLMLSIPENIPPLKIRVYDKDTFSTDDFMGEAEVDIQPLVVAARTSEPSAAFYDHQSTTMPLTDTCNEITDHDCKSNENGGDNDGEDNDNDNNSCSICSSNNNPVKDSGVITLEDGSVKQEITLKLERVESGELEIELECVALTQ